MSDFPLPLLGLDPLPVMRAYGTEPVQFGELYLPPNIDSGELFPLVIVIHGGFWRAAFGASLMNPLAMDLAKHGYIAWNIEYRRIGDENACYPNTFLDVALATDSVRKLATEYPIDLKRVMSLGHSAGGHLALWLAARHKIAPSSPLYIDNPLSLKGAISLAGVSDLYEAYRLQLGRGAVIDLLGGPPDAFPERYRETSPSSLLPLNTLQVLVHGEEDSQVPIAMSRSYLDKANSLGDRVAPIFLSNNEHFRLIDPNSEAWESIIDCLPLLEQNYQ